MFSYLACLRYLDLLALSSMLTERSEPFSNNHVTAPSPRTGFHCARFLGGRVPAGCYNRADYSARLDPTTDGAQQLLDIWLPLQGVTDGEGHGLTSGALTIQGDR
jgi:hypothetical protein